MAVKFLLPPTLAKLLQLYAEVCPTILALLVKVRLRKNDLKIVFSYYKDEEHEMSEHPQSLLG